MSFGHSAESCLSGVQGMTALLTRIWVCNANTLPEATLDRIIKQILILNQIRQRQPRPRREIGRGREERLNATPPLSHREDPAGRTDDAQGRRSSAAGRWVYSCSGWLHTGPSSSAGMLLSPAHHHIGITRNQHLRDIAPEICFSSKGRPFCAEVLLWTGRENILQVAALAKGRFWRCGRVQYVWPFDA